MGGRENAGDLGGELTVAHDLSFLGASWGADARMVDVRDGKALRICPACLSGRRISACASLPGRGA